MNKKQLLAGLISCALFLPSACASTENSNSFTTATVSAETKSLREQGINLLYDAQNRSDVNEAIRLLKQSADGGYIEAITDLGDVYYEADYVEQDLEEALKWFLLAANREDTYGAYSAGFMYYNGEGTPVDYEQAFKYYLIAAEGGDDDSIEMVAHMYAEGIGVAKDPAKAAQWENTYYNDDSADDSALLALLAEAQNGTKEEQHEVGLMLVRESETLEAAEKGIALLEQLANAGDPDVMTDIADFYYEAVYLEQDYEEALKWFIKAGDLGDSYGAYSAGYMFYNGEGAETNYPLAAKYHTIAAKAGDMDSMFELAIMYDEGTGVEQSYKQSAHWYQQAAEAGHDGAMYNLGVAYDTGEGVSQNFEKSAYWYQQAADLGNSDAMFNLSVAYFNGEGLTRNRTKAMHYLDLAVNEGDAHALYLKGVLYRDGDEGLRRDYGKALELLEAAAIENHTSAQIAYGRMLEKGQGIEKDKIQALAWYYIAEANGDSDAEKRIRIIKRRMTQEEQQASMDLFDELAYHLL
ncbi:tetratricopeptide repeat protein [Thaumasiovibrio subtropicus]|uniref:tetratricopeptide repeat protein n=1 Tax=Thaumasiovibrio subtropicus TaxID=1891207 RepID=UPI000B3649D3|nr:tetratricopeptide repeat protein [Thaumasiovibrio subtropicus]